VGLWRASGESGGNLTKSGELLGRLWGSFGEALGKLWGSFGETLGRLWEGFEKALGRLWEALGVFWKAASSG